MKGTTKNIAAARWVEPESSVYEVWLQPNWAAVALQPTLALSLSLSVCLILAAVLLICVRRVSAWLVVLNVCSRRRSSNNISFNSRYNNKTNSSKYNNDSSCQHHHPPTHLIRCLPIVLLLSRSVWAREYESTRASNAYACVCLHVCACVCVSIVVGLVELLLLVLLLLARLAVCHFWEIGLN